MVNHVIPVSGNTVTGIWNTEEYLEIFLLFSFPLYPLSRFTHMNWHTSIRTHVFPHDRGP